MGKGAQNRGNVLIVDDEPLNLDVLAQELEYAGYQTVRAASGAEALDKTLSAQPDVVLLDIMMPGMDGYETCRRLQAGEQTKLIPVIFMTALTDIQDKVRAFDAGGVDYITKPFQPEEVLARVDAHVSNRRLQQELYEQNERLRKEIEEHQRAKAAIEYLQDEINDDHNVKAIIGAAPVLSELLDKARAVASTETTVLIYGETGTGKELVARAIHHLSERRDSPLVKVNCAALPRELLESELFGHEKGAFTGATKERKGRFELAHKGTVFLDEIGELSAEAQAKLLRVLQEQEFERVGGEASIQVDVRVIAATNRILQKEVDSGNFRADLYYRLNVFPLTVPALRERPSDIPLLAEHFVGKTARKLGRSVHGVSPAAMAKLKAYTWPGNVRELENVLERSTILSPGEVVEISESLAAQAPATGLSLPAAGTLEEVERAHIVQVLTQTNWAIDGDAGAAGILGLNPSTLRGRIRKLGIKKKVSADS